MQTKKTASLPAKRFEHLCPGPDIKRAFVGMAVGVQAVRVFRGIKPATGMAQIPNHISKRVPGCFRKKCIARDLVRLNVGTDQLRLVIKHLLEVGHMPLAINAITMKPAPQMVAHSAHGHLAQAEEGHIPCMRPSPPLVIVPQQKRKDARAGEFWRAAKSSLAFVKRLGEIMKPRIQCRAACQGGGGFSLIAFAQGFHDVLALRLQALAICLPRFRDAGPSTVGKPALPYRSSGGKYVPPKKGAPSGVSHTLIGQPPLPVVACTKPM